MMIKKYTSDDVILYLLIFLVLASPLLLYMGVDDVRANQALWVQLVSLILLFLVLVRLVSGRKIVLVQDNVLFLFLLFFIYLSFSLFYSASRLLSFRSLLLFSSYLFLSQIIVHRKSKEKAEQIISAFVLSALLIAIYTILHYYGVVSYLAEFGPVFSPVGRKGWTAIFLSLVLPTTIALFFLENGKMKKHFYFATTVIIYTGILICISWELGVSLLLTIPVGFIFIKTGNMKQVFADQKRNVIYLFIIL